MDFADGGDLYTKIANQKKIGKGKQLYHLNLLSLLFGGSNSGLVRANGASDKTHPRPQDPAQRSEDAEHFHDLKRTDQDW